MPVKKTQCVQGALQPQLHRLPYHTQFGLKGEDRTETFLLQSNIRQNLLQPFKLSVLTANIPASEPEVRLHPPRLLSI